MQMFDKKAINERFFSFFVGQKQADLMKLFDVSQATISQWQTCRKQVPWEKLQYLVEREGLTWDWLLEGRGPMHRE